MAAAGRYVSDELDTFEIMMYRSLVGFLLLLIFSTVTNRLHLIQMGSSWVCRLNHAYQMVDPQTKHTFDLVYNDSEAACLWDYLRRL